MKRLAIAALTAGLGLAAAGCSSTPDASDHTITVSTFSFGTEQFNQVVVQPFEKATGIKVKVETGNNADRLAKLQVNKAHPTVDVMLISDYFAALGEKQGLFDKIDTAAVPNLSKIYDFAKNKDGYGPAYTFQLLGELYRTDGITDPQKAADWKTLWDGGYKGKIAVPDMAPTAGQLFLSATSDVFGSGPDDVESGFSNLTQLAPDVLKFYTSTTEVTSLLDRGEVVAAPALDSFAVDLVKAGKPIAWAVPAKGRYMATNEAQVVKGSAHKADAEKFIDFLLSADVQSKAAAAYYDKPVNKDATVPDVLTKVAGDAAKDPVAAGYTTLDMAPIVANRTQWVERYAREVSSK
ncbi:spermidine/putrescine ABC transporter substrate-binding protein [Planotetraspora thailandica]|uniref:Spermidine/putrescine ABC transporter substrate-binding protein n=1 Tax=Planotetraspora thailandica TaxID=487172 RepID=A0A8J3UY99_9ACTN|nr:ABC transporter substrate-binding protein [Planotetraspora thailandica]GII51691.1 spermidine/putrescine ABC transporter substrate-binding protein [Planotetraspora thailandica]